LNIRTGSQSSQKWDDEEFSTKSETSVGHEIDQVIDIVIGDDYGVGVNNRNIGSMQ